MKFSDIDEVMLAHRAKEFFLARQPILDREQTLAAYELLFRSAAAGPANVTDDLAATASVIAHTSELGMGNVVGASLGFLNVDSAVLMSDIVRFLPKDRVVLEILETVHVNDALIARVTELARDGYRFALDDVVATSESVERLLPLADIIKVDITDLALKSLTDLSFHFKAAGKKMLAEKVENVTQFQCCLDLGFDYFQGYYFAKPLVLSGKKMSPSQVMLIRLMAQVMSEADSAMIERSIKEDASLSLTLLRLVNNPVVGAGKRIDTVAQALAVLGRRQLQRWLQILVYAEPGAPKAASALLHLATTRGKLLELMARRIRPGDRHMADTAFTVGMLSLTDALFGLPLSGVLEQVSVADDVRAALMSRSGVYGDMLKLVECVEHVKDNCPQIAGLLEKLRLSSDEFNELELAAFQWSDKVSQSAA